MCTCDWLHWGGDLGRLIHCDLHSITRRWVVTALDLLSPICQPTNVHSNDTFVNDKCS